MSLDERLRAGLEGLDAIEGSPPQTFAEAVVVRGRRTRWTRRVAAGAVALVATIAVLVVTPRALDALRDAGDGGRVPVHEGPGKPLIRVPGYGWGFSDDGTHLFARDIDSGMGAVYDAATGAPVKTVSGSGEGVVAFSPDGNVYITVQGDPDCCHTYVYETATGRELMHIRNACCFAAFSADGRFLAVPRHGTTVFDLATGEIVNRFAPWGSMAFSPDGRRLLVSPFPDDAEKRVIAYIYAVGGGRSEPVRSLKADSGGGNVTDVYGDWRPWSTDGAMVAVPTSTGRVVVWDARTGMQLFEIAPPSGKFVHTAFDPNGRLATGSTDGTAIVWSLSGQMAEPLVTISAYDRRVDHVVFGPGGRLMTASWNRPTKVWDIP
jgi:WD40 repeat protein